MDAQKDTVFLTGATGFVGRHVASALLESGYPVTALVRPARKDDTALESRLPSELRGRVDVVAGDLLEAGHLLEALRECRYIVHAGALYSFTPSERRLVRETNVRGTASLLEAARLAGVEKE